MHDESDDALHHDNMQIGDVMVYRVGFKDAKKTLVTLKQCLEQRPSGFSPLI